MDYQPQINHRQHHFASQMQFQQKVVAKEPKLTFPEFDGTDPDGWIRKSKKFFELAAVPTEVNSVMYLSGKAEYWWRGTGCNPSTLPWHQFCRLLEDRFLEISTTEIIGQFHNLNQTATVPKYIDMFEEFMGLVKRKIHLYRKIILSPVLLQALRSISNTICNATNHPPSLKHSGLLEY